MNTDRLAHLRALSTLVATAALVAACGGGSSDSPAAPPPPAAGPPPAPSTVDINGRALDGPLQGATACYDLNDNKACDASEPSATTGADGRFTLTVAAAEAGKHRTIVNVPATAINADTGAAVGFAFTLVAPATGTSTAHSLVASPLSTLVQQQVDNAGQTATQAQTFVQSQLGLAVSPLSDFAARNNADTIKAANAAMLVVQTERQQSVALAPAVGQTDLSGGTVSQAQVDAQVRTALAGALAMIGHSATDVSLAGKTGSALATAVTALATNVVTQIGLTVPEAVVAVGVSKLPPDPGSTATPTEGATLSALRYASANDWYMRSFQSTAADNTPDANKIVRNYEVRTRTDAYSVTGVSPVVISWAINNDSNRAGDRYWNGSTWRTCSLGDRNTSTLRDSQGRSSYTTCDGLDKGTSVRSAQDISGQTLASVLTTIRALPNGNGGVNYADWPNPKLMGNATFPTGSRLFYQTNTALETAPAYDARSSNAVTVFSQAVVDGGDARVGTVACQNAGTPVATTNLEEMAARFPGKPCIFNAATNSDGTSLDPNEAWGTTSLSMGDVQNYHATLPAGTGNYYNNVGRMRVGFTGTGSGTTYYQCYVRRVDGSTRNCTAIGSGTYTIATLGDARVMSFNNVPAAFARTNFQRIVVERGGAVYYGYKNPVGIAAQVARPNMVAANALLSQLGLPTIRPTDAPQALTGAKATNQALMKGVWYFSDNTGSGILRVGDNGQYLDAITDPASGTQRPGLEMGWLDIDGAGKMNRVLELDANGSNGISHFDPTAVFSITSDRFAATINGQTESFDGRFPDSGTGIVGMWGVGSATDLKATQLAFFPNGRVLLLQPTAETSGACATARQGPPGIEWADYTFNATTGALRVFNKQVDTTGCTGLFDSSDGAILNGTANTEVNVVVTIAAGGKTATVLPPGEAPVTLYRIAVQ